jgi:hypothetical protein
VVGLCSPLDDQASAESAVVIFWICNDPLCDDKSSTPGALHDVQAEEQGLDDRDGQADVGRAIGSSSTIPVQRAVQADAGAARIQPKGSASCPSAIPVQP